MNETDAKKDTLTGILEGRNLNISTNPRGTDKGDCKTYVKGFYEAEFAPRRSARNRLLEIGVRSGASMALWANFFSDAELIGVDVEPVGAPAGPLKEYVDYPSVKFFCKDAYEESFAADLEGKFTILIDDGPHSLASQKRFLQLYLPKLEKGGVLIVEDVQRAYRDSFQLMRLLPDGFVFEVHDFRSVSGTGDDFLFVVRHGDGAGLAARKACVAARCAASYLAAPFRRAAALFSGRKG
ncbi:MAG: class I SAM-dependent methyltransferase [Elusimicrobia bacterium]|nr:class I SAM-dependent methyltransferase [Elusimicrobiota bacterium]